MNDDRRRYYRHPIGFPLRLDLDREGPDRSAEALDISLGGLSFLWPRRLSKGSRVRLTIPVKDKLFQIESFIAYTKEDRRTGKYRTGVSFADPVSAFSAKLAEELLEILQYRKKKSRELGRDIGEDEAAREWITAYSQSFPVLNSPSLP